MNKEKSKMPIISTPPIEWEALNEDDKRNYMFINFEFSRDWSRKVGIRVEKSDNTEWSQSLPFRDSLYFEQPFSSPHLLSALEILVELKTK